MDGDGGGNGHDGLLAHYGTVRRYLSSFRTGPVSAEDLAQDTFIRALRYHGARGPPESDGGWLIGIARNVGIERVRRAAYTRTEELDDEREIVDGKAGEPCEGMLDAEQVVRVRDALGQLREHDRYLLARVYFDGANYQELSHELGIRRSLVKVRAYRARERLRRYLERGA